MVYFILILNGFQTDFIIFKFKFSFHGKLFVSFAFLFLLWSANGVMIFPPNSFFINPIFLMFRLGNSLSEVSSLVSKPSAMSL